MGFIICALATYKVVQILDALSPREAMPWVKVLVATFLSFGAVGLMGADRFDLSGSFGHFLLAGFATATLAGTLHTVLRLLTLLGDRNRRAHR